MTATGAVSRRCLLSHVSQLSFAASSCGALGRGRTLPHVTRVTIAYLAKEAWRNFGELRKAEVQLRRTPLPRTPVNSVGFLMSVQGKGRDDGLVALDPGGDLHPTAGHAVAHRQPFDPSHQPAERE